ncbi:MAG TPA: SGNH/GDSL hydrolase family protein [Actinospica sp.]|jgi:lysophospholipase L1-like esterase|nr:SGNH/GDSL hydrolase family protein [Actinospica sp.]
MPITLPQGAVIVFQGDSITDAGRRDEPGDGLGWGYPRLTADLLTAAYPDAGLRFFNRGVGGNTAADLRARWQSDAIDLRPDVVSVLIGINDTWRRYDSDRLTTTESYEKDYRHILSRVRDETDARLLLIEPFLLPVRAEQWQWREDLDPRIHVVRRLASEFDAALLSADGLLNQAARTVGTPETIAPDGIHPAPEGHRLLAEEWARLVTKG